MKTIAIVLLFIGGCLTTGCGAEAVWYDLLFRVADPQPAPGEDGAVGQDGTPGARGLDGINCWDLNGNRINDEDEDSNGDGEWTALDCQGSPGPTGSDGSDGEAGLQGPKGDKGDPADADGHDHRIPPGHENDRPGRGNGR